MAHDGSDWGLMEQAAKAAAPPAGVMVARCASATCGAASALDVAEWLGDGLPLRAFEARLRCACGGRRVRLEPAAGDIPPVNPAIYRFR
ncbi:hypothetical protein [Phenylobacterium sp.]|jgi:hypothetical protein|uniref:hypothetical protein n=1 Tax=Phenylobacterium sp. TaxID=1871053 RepID=UPI002E31625F|nr:hypothetical protein [Phenylobacterium sp.]HEX2561990.1 hypothetical protein [Phenylobacterium sp.]